MDIRFGKLVARNFMSFRDVEFDFGSFGRKVVVVTGRNDDIAGGEGCRNGAGKTTIFSALMFAVYGEGLNGVLAANVANWNCTPKDNVEISLSVTTDGTEWRIERVLTGKRKAQELRVYRKNGDGDFEDASRSTIAETQRLVETEIVPCGKDGFLRCILFTADRNYNFFELGKAAKNEFFESLFELSVYTAMYKKLHRDTLDRSNSLVAASRTVDGLVDSVEKLKSERSAMEGADAEVAKAEEAAKDAEERLAAFDRDNAVSLMADGRTIEFDTSDRDAKIESGKAVAERIRKGGDLVASLKGEIGALTSEIASADARIKCERMSIDSMRHMLSAHSNITGILCEDCLPKYRTAVNIADYDERIEEAGRRIAEIEAGKAGIPDKIAEKRALVAKYEAGLVKLNSEVEAIRTEVYGINNRNNGIQMERDRLVNAVCMAKHAVSEIRRTASRQFDAPIESLETRIREVRSECAKLDDEVNHLRALEEVLKPENIRRRVVPDMLGELNYRICGYLSKMGSNYTCSFDDDFNAVFETSRGVRTSYNNFSAGEKMRLGIASCLAFRDFMQVRLNIRPNILAIDEYIDSSLDTMSVNGIMEHIRYMVGHDGMTAFIISHRSEVLNSMADVEVVVSKKDDASTIEITTKE